MNGELAIFLRFFYSHLRIVQKLSLLQNKANWAPQSLMAHEKLQVLIWALGSGNPQEVG